MSDDLIERLTICIEGTASVPNIQRAIQDGMAYIASLEAECAALKHDMERARDAANEHLAALAYSERRVIADVVKWLRTKAVKAWGEDTADTYLNEFAATALETGEWKKDSPSPPPVV